MGRCGGTPAFGELSGRGACLSCRTVGRTHVHDCRRAPGLSVLCGVYGCSVCPVSAMAVYPKFTRRATCRCAAWRLSTDRPCLEDGKFIFGQAHGLAVAAARDGAKPESRTSCGATGVCRASRLVQPAAPAGMVALVAASARAGRRSRISAGQAPLQRGRLAPCRQPLRRAARRRGHVARRFLTRDHAAAGAFTPAVPCACAP